MLSFLFFFSDNTKAVYQSIKDEKRVKNQCWEGVTCGQNTLEAPTSTGTVGLPPNIVFEPKDSEPFTLQSVCTARPQNLSCPRKDADNCRDLGCKYVSSRTFAPYNYEIKNTQRKNFLIKFDFVFCVVGDAFRQIVANENKCDVIAPLQHDPMGDYYEKFVKRNENSPVVDQSAEDGVEKSHANLGPTASQTLVLPTVMQEQDRKRKSAQREEELHILALSEAQLKVDIAVMLKEEAKIKLEEAHYLKEEARLRMLLFTYKLDRKEEEI